MMDECTMARWQRAMRLNLLRHWNGLTITDCSKQIGLSDGQARAVFRGRGINTPNIKLVADFFNVPLEWVLHGENDSPEFLPYIPEVSKNLHDIRMYLGYTPQHINSLTSISPERLMEIENQYWDMPDLRGLHREVPVMREWDGKYYPGHDVFVPVAQHIPPTKKELNELLDLYGITYDDMIWNKYLESDLDIWKIPNYYTNMSTGQECASRRHNVGLYLGNKIRQRRLELGISLTGFAKQLGYNIPASAMHLERCFIPKVGSERDNVLINALSLNPEEFYDIRGIDEWIKINL